MGGREPFFFRSRADSTLSLRTLLIGFKHHQLVYFSRSMATDSKRHFQDGPQRQDGRLSHQMRAPTLEEGLLHRADGSCRLSMGNTMALAAVFGPAVGRSRGFDRPDALTIEIVLDRNSGVPFDKIVVFKSIVHDVMESVVCVEQYPRCNSKIVEASEDDGGKTRTKSKINGELA